VNILFIHHDPEFQAEIDDYLCLPKGQGFFARDTEQAIRILNTYEISMVVLRISNLRDAAILRYVNDNYQHLKVLIMASREYDDIISVFCKGRYKLFRQPQHLSELKENIDSYFAIES
jgi:DNA-binding response OmpR family regulator